MNPSMPKYWRRDSTSPASGLHSVHTISQVLVKNKLLTPQNRQIRLFQENRSGESQQVTGKKKVFCIFQLVFLGQSFPGGCMNRLNSYLEKPQRLHFLSSRDSQMHLQPMLSIRPVTGWWMSLPHGSWTPTSAPQNRGGPHYNQKPGKQEE